MQSLYERVLSKVERDLSEDGFACLQLGNSRCGPGSHYRPTKSSSLASSFITIITITIIIDIVFLFHHSSLLFLHLLIGCLQTQNAKYSKKLELTSKEEGERKKMGI